MADVLALVSKAIFDAAIREHALALGVVWPTTHYTSTNMALTPLAEGGRLFLATVRPPDEALWIVAILERPTFDGKRWTARANTTPIGDVSRQRASLRFASGAGLPTKAGVLGMSLQTPRTLTIDDAAILMAGNGARRSAPAARPKPRSKPQPKRASREVAGAAPTVDQAALLANWQRTRSAHVADVLQLVPVDAKWTARLGAIAKGPTSWAIRDRLRKLPDDDPRVTVFLIECLRKAKWPGAGGRTLWSLIFRRLVELRDARAIAPLRAAAATPPYFLGAAHTKWIVAQIEATADALSAATAKSKADDAATRALVAAQPVTPPADGWFAAASDAQSGDKWIRDVWATPDDDAVRAVVADALLEQGDPWGELISFQLHGGTKYRAAAAKLVRKHFARFVGPIAKVATKRDAVFERGFLAECHIERQGLMTGRRLWDEAIKAPHWVTVRTVRIGIRDVPLWWPAAWYATAALASLREILVGNVALVRASATAPWTFAKAPERVDSLAARMLEAVLKGLPVGERARMAPPRSNVVRRALEDVNAD